MPATNRRKVQWSRSSIPATLPIRIALFMPVFGIVDDEYRLPDAVHSVSPGSRFFRAAPVYAPADRRCPHPNTEIEGTRRVPSRSGPKHLQSEEASFPH